MGGGTWKVRWFKTAQFGVPAVLLAYRLLGHEVLYGLGWQMYS